MVRVNNQSLSSSDGSNTAARGNKKPHGRTHSNGRVYRSRGSSSSRGGTLSTGSSSNRQSSCRSVRRGRVTKQRNSKRHRDKRAATSKSGGSRSRGSKSVSNVKTTTTTARRQRSSLSIRDSCRETHWGTVYSVPDLTVCSQAGTSRSYHHPSREQLNHSWSESMELSSRDSYLQSRNKQSILKPRDSGPTCVLPVRFQLPGSGKIVYPTKMYNTHYDCTCSSSTSDEDYNP